MSDVQSDAFEFFGATGDLACTKAGWNLEQFQARAKDSSRSPSAVASCRRRSSTERVLGDAVHGDTTLFAREDYVEEAWRIVDPVLTGGTPLQEYEPGTWGPKEVDLEISPPDGWHKPTVKSS